MVRNNIHQRRSEANLAVDGLMNFFLNSGVDFHPGLYPRKSVVDIYKQKTEEQPKYQPTYKLEFGIH
jgi:hypothetical protein